MNPKTLKVGDRIRFVSLPEEWNKYPPHKESLTFMKKMIARKFSSRISEKLNGYPVIKAKIKNTTHYWTIFEKTGWAKVQRKVKIKS